MTVALETVSLERRLDGAVEAVNQATVSAQTSGRVAEILYDVNDFVPAGAGGARAGFLGGGLKLRRG